MISLMVAYYNQAREFELCRWSCENQTHQPMDLILAIDDSRQPVPDLGALPWKVVRTGREHDGQYSRGALVNEAAKVARGHFLVMTDADCLLHPMFCEVYQNIMRAKHRWWTATVHNSDKLIRIERPDETDLLQTVLVGPRHHLESVEAAERIPRQWERFQDAAWHDPHGYRATRNGRAALQGCNMAVSLHALRRIPFPARGVREDERWWARAHREKFRAIPVPDLAHVLHMGPIGVHSNNNRLFFASPTWQKPTN